MEFTKVIAERKSIRKYDMNKAVPGEVLLRVLEAARIAPSAVNFQPWHFIVIKEQAFKERLKEVYPRDWFWTAPLVVVGCVDTKSSWKRKDGKDFSEIDITIAMDHLILAATNEGLGTCWVGAFDNAKAREVLKVPEHINIVLMTPLGYPAERTAATKPRKSLEEIIHKESW
ncbi:MAG: nitroreductase family protein [Candidatus Firestonebacteria bacterium]